MAPIYTYVGDAPRLLTDLIEGVNAFHTPAPGNPSLVAGQTVVVEKGDTVDTKGLDYPAFELHDEATGAPTVTVTAAPVEEPAPAAPVAEAPAVPAPVVAPAPAPAPVPDPAPAPGTVPAQPAPTV